MCCAYILQVDTETFQVVSALIAKQLAIDVNDVWVESKFTDLGVDSLDSKCTMKKTKGFQDLIANIFTVEVGSKMISRFCLAPSDVRLSG